MHIVTFYSFKGGVGRTMALANVAFELIRRGRRVLVVDFDLEAPGLPTFDLFSSATDQDGIVDYVAKYLETSEAPPVEDFTTDCTAESMAPGRLWVMPSGRQNSTYTTRLNSIDWQRLYSERDGFLLFEDMKSQWLDAFQPDYVLIDSRTGHTDVGGICTRQLPNAVVAMFFPNEQNIAGLAKVVKEIRREALPPREKAIDIHFVISNVPELDDEEGILQRRLEHAQRALTYQEANVVIHHYNSLSLLNQALFTKERPRSRLAREYVALADVIIANNPQDREGAVSYLRKLHVSLVQPSSERGPAELNAIEDRLESIGAHHPRDGEILALMAGVKERIFEPESAILLLNAAAESGYNKPDLLVRRAVMHRALSQNDAAVADLKSALRSSNLDAQDAYFAVRLLGDLSPEAFYELGNFPSLQILSPSSKFLIANEMLATRQALPIGEQILRDILTSKITSPLEKKLARSQLSLNLIGQRRFEEAVNLIKEGWRTPATIDDVASAFNFAIASWGMTGHPDSNLFAHALALTGKRALADANWFQCLAISYLVTGQPRQAHDSIDKARQALRSAPRRVFSAWRFLSVAPPEFSDDLDAIERLTRGESETPRFLSEQ
ncbi:AAA family ATPase [Pyxidicoccus fallax]|uniref:AAA family ATPase n=1 Tax=Pyxidicoccus fallax TaxID=394095 RepID=A0A848LST2_9BACT|nr:AAA family ATPase [Pyxidicoccus fallax]NMO20682.1 AAA family ATPase [Pyxidicoccus fallax]NPC85137.1 AAA family ATPase [Pyxidicoccus fallax]